MSSEIFEEWVGKVDRKFRVDGRKIALIIDICPAHPTLFNLTNVQLVFLPPNTTSILQPMDQGVIQSLNNLRKVDSSMVPNDVTVTALVSLDDDVIATAPEMNEDDIVSRLKNQEKEEEESGDEEILWRKSLRDLRLNQL
ncbi:tigger transposable element-derived protein 7-like [Penaeus monodon]|uniref:tigger transposable element-derived protein 7-like n=1 Tax=Penaeus monodon TaxID=6687 RepID=UPI0018A71414|nr:tigger transposable element-derived protein 7-like [Penaeus monodon]